VGPVALPSLTNHKKTTYLRRKVIHLSFVVSTSKQEIKKETA